MDTNKINQITINNQTWMNSNLNTTSFRNGDIIHEAKTNKEWDSLNNLQEPAWCYYNNIFSSDSKYGKLYNWYAINDKRNIAPIGWHIPTKKDWLILFNNIADTTIYSETKFGTTFYGNILNTKMKSTNGWAYNSHGDNESGFTALPAGIRWSSDSFSNLGTHSLWWCSSVSNYKDDGKYFAYGIFLTLDNCGISSYPKSNGLSIRCIKD